MTLREALHACLAGWAGGFLGNAFLGAAFSSPWMARILYDPHLQSALFISLTPQRDVAVSVMGLIALSAIHGLLFAVLRPAIPGRGWVRKGLWWGAAVWSMYWLFQEWFIYVTLLREPLALAALELIVLLAGSLIEGVVVARVVMGRDMAPPRSLA
jgi:hypothetical protein